MAERPWEPCDGENNDSSSALWTELTDDGEENMAGTQQLQGCEDWPRGGKFWWIIFDLDFVYA